MSSEKTDQQVSRDSTTEADAADGQREGQAPEGAAPRGAEDPSGDGRSAGEEQALRDKYLRLAAEYDNFRKRSERERAESWVRAQAQLVEKLLEPLDDLQRVADFAAENTSVEALLEGVQMVERKLLRSLESAGLETIEAEGVAFDPQRHEALMAVDTEDRAEDETVGQVLQNGYQFKGVLLRPARVQVKKFGG